jgi:hypothetical protein
MELEIINLILDTLLPILQDSWLLFLIDGEGYLNLSLLSDSKSYELIFFIIEKWSVNTII